MNDSELLRQVKTALTEALNHTGEYLTLYHQVQGIKNSIPERESEPCIKDTE